MENSFKLYDNEFDSLKSKSLFSSEEIEQILANNSNLFDVETIEESEVILQSEKWKILIVDDEADVHKITKLNLTNFQLNNKEIEFFHAYSAKEAETILSDDLNICLVFLDVVMETDHAGLELVKYIREVLKNDMIQIILNTGQPGKAPEKEIISKYDINYYQTKAEFTESKLFTITASSIRAYDSLYKIKTINQSLEEKVTERTKKLVLALNTKNKLFSIIAHDLRNPFNIILGFTDLLQLHSTNFDRQQILKFASTINSSAKEIFELLNNLFDWARSQNDTITVNSTNVNLNDLINKTIKLHTSEIENKYNTLKVEQAENINVVADVEMTKTILRNLISNAIKFTENGEIVINTTIVQNECKITIQDTGTGFDAEKLKEHLELNTISSQKGTRREKGTGLGLLVCKEFVSLNKGNFNFSSILNKGSKFHFTLPLANSQDN